MMQKKEAVSLALAEKKAAADEKRQRFEKARADLYARTPRLAEIDHRTAELGAQIALTALSGNTGALHSLQEDISALSEEKRQLLEAGGLSVPEFDCPLCEDTGYQKGKVCACVQRTARQILYRALCAEMPLEHCRFDNFDLNYYPDEKSGSGVNPRKKMTAVLKLCREYVLNFTPETAPNLLFMGNTGLGKTHLTLAVVAGILDRGYDVIYGSSFNLLSVIEKEHFSGNRTEHYEAMLECDLLVIDDLGTEFVSPFVQTTLYGLINSRLLTHRPTIINTNLTMREIEERYSDRIASRLIGCYTARKFFGPDIRQIRALEEH